MTAPYVVTLGETMALFSSDEPGPIAHAATARISIGGAESNVAIALRRLGVDATWIGRRGDDSLGDLVERELRGEGVRTIAVVDPDAPTGLMVKERRAARATRVWYYRAGSAGSRLQPDDVPAGIIESAAQLHVTGITPALSESAHATITSAVARAVEAGVPVSLDVNHRARLWGGRSVRDVLLPLAAASRTVFGGLDELRLLVGTDDGFTLARAVAALGPTDVIVKLGDEGCIALVGGDEYAVPAVPAQVVDSVGAGDAFVAGYLAGQVWGSGAGDRLALAVRLGAFACETIGDWEGLPFLDELPLLGATEPVSR